MHLLSITDPQIWLLAGISIAVVFAILIILVLILGIFTAVAKKTTAKAKAVKNTIENGVPGKYCFWLDAKSWCDTMDKLLEEHRDVIANALEHKYQADSVNLLAPYIGEIIDLGLFQKSRIQKTDLISSFSAYYGKPMSSVQTKLSTSYPEQFAFNDLVGETYKIATKKHK